MLLEARRGGELPRRGKSLCGPVVGFYGEFETASVAGMGRIAACDDEGFPSHHCKAQSAQTAQQGQVYDRG